MDELKTTYMEAYSKSLTCSYLLVSVWEEARDKARENLKLAGMTEGSIRSLEKIVCREINHEWKPIASN